MKPYTKEQSIGPVRKKEPINFRKKYATKPNPKLIQAYKQHPVTGPCQCCGTEPAIDHDHTISQARCKQLKKPELIHDPNNWSLSCRTCHGQWESYRSGEFEDHLNVVERMKFVKIHDPEGFEKRFQNLSNYQVMIQLK